MTAEKVRKGNPTQPAADRPNTLGEYIQAFEAHRRRELVVSRAVIPEALLVLIDMQPNDSSVWIVEELSKISQTAYGSKERVNQLHRCRGGIEVAFLGSKVWSYDQATALCDYASLLESSNLPPDVVNHQLGRLSEVIERATATLDPE